MVNTPNEYEQKKKTDGIRNINTAMITSEIKISF